jgi:hypothetical protein
MRGGMQRTKDELTKKQRNGGDGEFGCSGRSGKGASGITSKKPKTLTKEGD